MKIRRVHSFQDLLLPKSCNASSNSSLGTAAPETKTEPEDASISGQESLKVEPHDNQSCNNAIEANIECNNSDGQNEAENRRLSEETIPSVSSVIALNIEGGDANSKSLLVTTSSNPIDICTLQKKYLEEKQRGQKYEQLIKELKNTAVKLQDSAATAVDIDKDKNKEIETCYVALIEATKQIVEVNEKKAQFEQYFQQQLTKYDQELTHSLKNVSYYEQEAAKSFQIANEYQKELNEMKRVNSKLIEKLGKLEPALIEVQNKYMAKIESNKQLHGIILQKEEELKETRVVLLNSKVEFEQSTTIVQDFKNQYNTLKREYVQLKKCLTEYNEQVKKLEYHNFNLLSENAELKAVQNKMHKDIVTAKLTFEKNHLELKTYCCSRMSTALEQRTSTHHGKLSHEENLQNAMCSVTSINKNAVGHIEQLNERYVRIINLLQEKHREEINLYQVKLEMEQVACQNLRAKFRELYEKRQLYNVSEIQWIESLNPAGTGDQITYI